MAFPKLLQRLFQNNGAGDKLNKNIIPDIPYSKVTGAPTVDSSLSDTSTNAIQNKVVKSALDGKLSLSGGTMTGTLTAPALWLTSGDTTVGSVRGGLGNYAGLTIYGNQGSSAAWQEGAYAVLRSANAGLDSEKGKFALIASLNSSKYVSLSGSPDGTLTWGGKNVLTGNSVGLTVVSESYGANSWYRKYSDGWIEQGISFSHSGYYATRKVTINYPLPFTQFFWETGGRSGIGNRGSSQSGDNDTAYTYGSASFSKTGITISWSGDTSGPYVTVSGKVMFVGK